MAKTTGAATHPMSEFWHARHSCGRAIYWCNPEIAVRAAPSPCPWCGAENGRKVPQDVAMIGDPRAGVMAFREIMPDGHAPWPSEVPDGPDQVTVHHLPGGICCNN
jgi:hypothetical protein